MARTFLEAGEAYEAGASQTTLIGNADSSETIKLPGNAKTTFDASFARGGDVIEINGNPGDYTMVRDGSNIRLTSTTGAVIIIPVGTAGATVQFNDGEARDLVIEDGKFLLGDQDFTSGSVVVGGEPGQPPVSTTNLTVGADDLTGTAGNDLFVAKIIQNANGEQTNALGTGDSINGGAGDDKLSARVQDASPLNAGPGQAIAIDSTNVETLAFEAVQTRNNILNNPDDLVEISAKNIYGAEQFESYYSDASLRIYDVNTLLNGGVDTYGERRITADLTFVMDHTSGASAVENPSDFIALFDNDYLLAAPPSTVNSSITIELVDIDNQIDSGQPLLTNPFDRLYLTVDGVALQAIEYVGKNDLVGIAAYQELARQINIGLAARGLTTFTATVNGAFEVVDPDGQTDGGAINGKATGFQIVITDSAGSVITAPAFGASGQVPANEDYQKEIFATPPANQYNLITSNLVVDKVGRGGEGGDFQVGAMSASETHPSGVERFNLLVRGDASETSNLASLSSTNNYLREVYVTSEGGSGADLIIGNGQTSPWLYGDWGNSQGSEYPAVPNGADGRTDDVTSARNYALVDVQVFDATDFVNDLTLNAVLTSDFTGKYLDLMDDDATTGEERPTATADNVAALYTFAGGDDTLNINIDKSNVAHDGAVTREDFAFAASMGAGDDTVQVQLGNGEASLAEVLGDDANNWYVNHVINDNLSINTGAGDDFVNTWGASAARITLGEGDDLVYTDNSGTNDDYFNNDKATWVFNSTNHDVDNLGTQTKGSISKVANLSLFVQFQGIEVVVQVGNTNGSNPTGYTVTDLEIVQAIKNAVNNTILGDFLTAQDGPSGTLLVKSDIDGQVDVSDFTLRLITTPGSSLSAGQITNGVRNMSNLPAADLDNIGFLTSGWAIGAGEDGERFASEFGEDGGNVLDGQNSDNLNNNRVYGGTGNDSIVLSSQNSSIEHVEYKRGEKFGFDTILNFTAASDDEITENASEVQTITVEGAANQPSSITVTMLETTVTVAVPALATADDIGELIEGALNDAFADAGMDAVAVNAGGVVTATGPLGVNYADPVAPITQAAETQTITFSGTALAGETIQITFDGTVANAVVGAGAGAFAAALAELVTELNVGTQTATVSGNVITVVNDENGNIPPAIVQVTESAPGVGSNLNYEVNSDPEGANLGFTLEAETVEDGANVELGFDIFDLSSILGVAGPAPIDFINDNPLASGNDYLDNHEHAAIDAGTLNRPSVFIVDTLEAGDWSGFAATSTNELLRLTDIIKDADDTAHIGGPVYSVVITVDADNVGTFYQVTNGNGVGDATVTELGKVELGFYELDGKEAIGNWGQMTVDNFTSLTPTELVNVYGSSFAF